MDNQKWQHSFRERLGARIRGARGKITQGEISTRLESLGVTLAVSAISEIERGGRRVSVEELLAIAVALDVAPSRLLIDYEGQLVVGQVSMSPEQAHDWISGDVVAPGSSLFAEYRFLYVNQPPERKEQLDRAMAALRKLGTFPESLHGVIEPDNKTMRRALGAMLNVEYVTDGTMFGRPAAGSMSPEEFARFMGMSSEEEQ